MWSIIFSFLLGAKSSYDSCLKEGNINADRLNKVLTETNKL
uniref:Uncharacterized protein n=1 Tax=Arundo donax TaxID=35708 RepID=A0A0A9E192_ARUDO